MNCPRIVIAAPSSGSGKTTVTCALLEALRQKGVSPCAFKCGPDYIDPMYHRNVIGVPSGNLDLFFTDEKTMRRIFCQECSGDVAVIEGVMGLFDGLGGIEEEASTYHLAKTIDAPILLVVDAKGVGRSILATIRGFMEYDKDNRIRGILLNRVSARFSSTLASIIEKELGIPVLGYMPNQQNTSVKSRHLGLVLPEEVQDLRITLEENAKRLSENVDLARILEIAQSAPELAGADYENLEHENVEQEDSEHGCSESTKSLVRIGIAQDEAFCFYYRENLEMLESMGVELVPFSPLHDEHLPEDIHGLLMGGGYPELHLEELSANESMKVDIRELAKADIPLRAECGAFMYLGKSIVDSESGVAYEMVGLTDGEARRGGLNGRFGYVTLTPNSSAEIQGEIRAHEFHYYDTSNNGNTYQALKPVSGKTWNAIIRKGNQEMGFPHLYYPSNPDYAKRFLQQCMDWKKEH